MGYIGKTFKRPITKEIMGYYKILDVEEDNQFSLIRDKWSAKEYTQKSII